MPSRSLFDIILIHRLDVLKKFLFSYNLESQTINIIYFIIILISIHDHPHHPFLLTISIQFEPQSFLLTQTLLYYHHYKKIKQNQHNESIPLKTNDDSNLENAVNPEIGS